MTPDVQKQGVSVATTKIPGQQTVRSKRSDRCLTLARWCDERNPRLALEFSPHSIDEAIWTTACAREQFVRRQRHTDITVQRM